MPEDIVKLIKELKIQSSRTITIESLKHLKRFSKTRGFGKPFDAELQRILNARKTAVTLFNALHELKKDKSLEKINELIKDIQESTEKLAEYGSHLIKPGYRVHTHCHSTEALAVIKQAAKKKRFTVVIDETRPKEQGIKTAKELSDIRNIDVVLITDDAAGLALSHHVIPIDNIVIVGSDALRKEGVINKIGTYMMAVVASENNIPFYVAASTWKYDTRKKFDIEMRDPSEVYKKIKNVKILNPAFDITPWKYVTGVITEKGIKKPKKVLQELRSEK